MKKIIVVSLVTLISFSSSYAGEFDSRLTSTSRDSSIKFDLLPFREGAHLFSAGYGFGNYLQSLFLLSTERLRLENGGFGPAHLKYEYTVTKNIGLGLSFNYLKLWANTEHIKYVYTYDPNGNLITQPVTYSDYFTFTTFSVIPRVNFHFATTRIFDPYFGFGFGYRSERLRIESGDPIDSSNEGSLGWYGAMPVGFETTIGTRFFITDNFAIYTEAGLAKSVLQFGAVG